MGDNFKTMGSVSVGPPTKSLKPQNPEAFNSRPGPNWCLIKAKAIFGCYRRDEAHDPETFALALAAVLAEFPIDIIEYAADPRTGVINEFPMGLPNVGQIKQFCEEIQEKKYRAMQHAQNPIKAGTSQPIKPPERKKGQYTYGEFLEMAVRGEVKSRPIGRFEE